MAGEDRRIIKTKRAISAAFWQLLDERDFKDISVNDVAAAAEISRTTFYHHYADKYHWLEQTICEHLAQYIAPYRDTDLQNRDILIDQLTELFRNISSDAQLCKLLLVNENSQLMYQFFRDSMLDQHQELQGASSRLSPEEDLTIHYIAASTSAFIEWWVRNDTLFTPEQLANCIYSFHHMQEEKT